MSEPNAQSGSGKSRRSSLIAVVVGAGVILAVGVAAGMLLLYIQRAREEANRLECVNNLKHVGIALHNYHDTHNRFPTEAGAGESFYRQISPFMHRGNWMLPPQVKSYLCPARRTVETAPGKRDFGYATSQTPAWSILNSDDAVGLGVVNAKKGTDHTLLMSHLWMAPATYARGDPTDFGWHFKSNARSINDAAMRDDDPTGSIHHIGSPHAEAMPCLFADGHVQAVRYDFSFWAQAWAWNNTQPYPRESP